MNPLDFTEERLSKIDKLFVKTKYHRNLLPNIPDDKFVVIGNGITLDRFKNNVTKNPHRFIYSSTPNRGLDILLEYMWDDIVKEIPDAEIHTYYGFNTFYELEKNNPERMLWMKKMQKLMEKPGVVNHGRVNQAELASDILKSSFWLYPTFFAEIHCITACEMQAGGCIPITSGYAALEETVLNGITVEGDVYDPKYHKEFVSKVVEMAKKDNIELINKTINDAQSFDWDIVADEWYKQFSNL
jgi:glycosyltransferase involved in cell wall biosynthesis